MTKRKQSVSGCIFNNSYIYAIGGQSWNDSFLNDIEMYNIMDNAWHKVKLSQEANLLSPRYCCLSIQINDRSILIAGGFGE